MLILGLAGGAWSPNLAQGSLDELIFSKQLDSLGGELFVPVEGYRTVNRSDNEFLPTLFARYSRKDKVELRVLLIPDKPQDIIPPHVRTGPMAIHLASNEENSQLVGTPMGDSLLQILQADWGLIFEFVPKRGFSIRRQCRLSALYKEGRGIAYAFLLYDDDNAEVRRREYMFRFKD